MTDRARARIRVALSWTSVAACLLGAWPAAADTPDWASVADVQEIFSITTNEDGSERETKIWLVVLDGDAFIRTSKSTRWGKNVVRNPDIVVRIDDTLYPVHVRFIEDEALRDRVIDAFREKYGATDWWLQIFRGRSPRIMQLEQREPG